jgi:hypothetical protein
MTEVDIPIDAGALYRETESNNYTRVRRLWADEDLTIHVEIAVEAYADDLVLETDTITLEDLSDRIQEGKLIRHNTDHEAWRWREE